MQSTAPTSANTALHVQPEASHANSIVLYTSMYCLDAISGTIKGVPCDLGIGCISREFPQGCDSASVLYDCPFEVNGRVCSTEYSIKACSCSVSHECDIVFASQEQEQGEWVDIVGDGGVKARGDNRGALQQKPQGVGPRWLPKKLVHVTSVMSDPRFARWRLVGTGRPKSCTRKRLNECRTCLFTFCVLLDQHHCGL